MYESDTGGPAQRGLRRLPRPHLLAERRRPGGDRRAWARSPWTSAGRDGRLPRRRRAQQSGASAPTLRAAPRRGRPGTALGCRPAGSTGSRERPPFKLDWVLPRRLGRRLDTSLRTYKVPNSIGKAMSHLYGVYARAAYAAVRDAARRGRAGLHAHEAGCQGRRRVLGRDDRGPRQLPDVPGSSSRKARTCSSSRLAGGRPLPPPAARDRGGAAGRRRAGPPAGVVGLPSPACVRGALRRSARGRPRSGERDWERQNRRSASALGGVTPPLVPQSVLRAPRAPVPPPARARRRGAPRDWLEPVITHEPRVPHGGQPRAVRLFALHPVRRRARRGREPHAHTIGVPIETSGRGSDR